MGFINEYVSDENVKKYKLDELWLEHHPWKKTLPYAYKHHWTYDHKNNIFLKLMKIGKEEFSNRTTFILFVKGDVFEVVIDVDDSSSHDFSEQPYKKILNLVKLRPKLDDDKYKEIIEILKNALSTYGVSGIVHQVPNTIVTLQNI